MSDSFILVPVVLYTISFEEFLTWLILSKPVANNFIGLLTANAVIRLNGY